MSGGGGDGGEGSVCVWGGGGGEVCCCMPILRKDNITISNSKLHFTLETFNVYLTIFKTHILHSISPKRAL